ncbi:MAG: hypothetical protein A2X25_03690 [Chloroflexi bacterium GWB2_49_20]|nr:MAG: hypothetical protein A2X25_03690 [Chloroflexi bacterium GWB2_49_20]OGN76689.1 MAG: hypothetical protein A2X26_10780 [Chloroflexi bacterium GWC2_49_37]OGN83649.1 MAG: hypothetical protein A2X27_01435 [Chloroflexi bacterium GWD2_49_16]HBG74229.1 hypothetical protein [Anaerolineae bacterium]HCC79435.1 hypothetical protein [Anaerolineae bacterium]
MSNKKVLLLVGVLIAAAFILTACAGPAGAEGPAGPAGPSGATGPAGAAGVSPAATDLTCTECHNDGTELTSKTAMWAASLHGSSLVYVEEAGRAQCSFCHDGSAFSESVAAGLAPNKVEVVHTNATPQDCRACHQIHTTYTSADWALETVAPVAFFAAADTTKATFDGGMGNLCANCHQVRSVFTPATDGNVKITSSRYGPHYGPMSSILLGTGGAGLEGKPSAHYSMVENTCVTCHLGEGTNHTFTPQVSACVACHADATDFDINGVQTEVEEKLEVLHTKLVDMKLLNPDTGLWGIYDAATGKWSNPSADAPLVVTEEIGNAMWNYKMVVYDLSNGVHNSAYTKALLDATLAALP